MVSVMGYADRRSVRVGERIQFKVSVDGSPSYKATIVRLISPQSFPQPHAPDFKFETMACPVNGEHKGQHHEIPAGSYAEIPAHPKLSRLTSCTLVASIWPTLPGSGEQAILGTVDGSGGLGLHLDKEGRLALVVGGQHFVLPRKLRPRRWSFVAASLDAEAGVAILYAREAELYQFDTLGAASKRFTRVPTPAPSERPFRIAAAHDGPKAIRHFNGKIERPRVLGRALSLNDLDRLAPAGPTGPAHVDAIADWDFSRDISSEIVSDVSHNGLWGRTINLPTRAVASSNWNAERHDWRAVPEQYGAIHFHDDDIYDALWPTAFEVTIPDGWKSTTYALRLEAGDSEFWVPFFVRPKQGEAKARCAFLVPTCTYAAYSNFRSRVEGRWSELYHGRVTVLDRTDFLMEEYPDLGSSTYDPHRDGSLTLYSSMMRPVTNFRPTGRVYKFCQDMFFIAWLEHQKIDYEIVTDDDLHYEGVAAISDYACIFTGSHPEYYSTEMLDAVESFLRRGGRFMYLGGNGFYWRTAYHATLPGVVEVRRAGQGFLASDVERESNMSFTGEIAGTWHRVGRPPQLICGVGMVTQGFDACTGYKRTKESHDPRAAFIFKDVKEEIVGDFGVLMGGAAGYEIDRHDVSLGSPRHSLRLASSWNHTNVYDISVPSFTDLVPKPNEDAPDPVRADIVFFETPGGGAVFSVGSIAWSGSLSWNNYDNNIERITRNVLMRFIDPKPFQMPVSA
ncbi:MAG: LamG domain-containing protein [Alphaproteobacteria bacterium]|nr:LamG domain-containing protein [Alphaproteobacteria bacterium]